MRHTIGFNIQGIASPQPTVASLSRVVSPLAHRPQRSGMPYRADMFDSPTPPGEEFLVDGETIPEVIDRLVTYSGQLAAENPDPPVWELTSDREVTGSDPEQRVEVTIGDYAVRSVRIDPDFLMAGDLSDLEDAIAVAATTALKQFLKEEMEEAAAGSSPMGEVHAQLVNISRDVTAAFDRHMDILDAKVRML